MKLQSTPSSPLTARTRRLVFLPNTCYTLIVIAIQDELFAPVPASIETADDDDAPPPVNQAHASTFKTDELSNDPEQIDDGPHHKVGVCRALTSNFNWLSNFKYQTRTHYLHQFLQAMTRLKMHRHRPFRFKH